MTIRGETTAINVNVTPEAQVRPVNTGHAISVTCWHWMILNAMRVSACQI